MIAIGNQRKVFTNLGLKYLFSETRLLSIKQCQPKTCGIVVIGDEILKGQVQDTNSYFLSNKLYSFGIKVMKVSVICDNVDLVSSEVKKFSKDYDFVLTTGGIGPTHDDITYQSVAKAFDLDLHYDPVLTQICFDFFKTNDINHPSLKLAYIPAKSKLTFGYDEVTKKRSLYPNVSVNNVYIFPGVPHLCKRMFNFISPVLFSTGDKFHVKQLFIVTSEDKISEYLSEAVKKYPEVTIGSYPDFFHSYYSVKITIESNSEDKTNQVIDFLRRKIPCEHQINFDFEPFKNKSDKLQQIKSKILNSAMDELTTALKIKKSDEIFFYFDGGKNSTLLLHMLSVLYEQFWNNMKINAVYVETNSKIHSYVLQSAKNYNLNILNFNINNLKKFIHCDDNFVLIKGTRRKDPNFEKISMEFKGVNMINPLIDWSYSDVWKTIRILNLPYCRLYDEGFTSICHSDIKQNPSLITDGPRKDIIYYKKAHQLTDETLENL